MGLTRKQLVLVATLLLAAVFVMLNLTILSPAFPAIMDEFGIDSTTVQWLTSGYSMVEAILIPLSAFLVGRFSIRTLFVAGYALFALGSLLGFLASDFGVLMTGRMLQAAATGVVMPMGMTCIILTFPRKRRGMAMGVVSLIMGFAPAVGPTVAGLLIDFVGWRALFAIIMACCILLMAIGWFTVQPFCEFERVGFDLPSLVMSCAGLFLLLYGLSTFSSASSVAVPAAMIAAGVAIIGCFVIRQGKLEVPMLRIEVLKSSRFAMAVLVMAFIQAALASLTVLLPLFIQIVLGQSATVSGFATLPGALLGAFMAVVAGRLFNTFGARKLGAFGAVLAVAGSVALSLLDMDSSVVAVAASYALVSMVLQFMMTPLNTWGMNSLDNRVVQHANGVLNTCNQISMAFGTALVVSLGGLASTLWPAASAVEQAWLGDRIGFVAITVMFVLALLVILLRVSDRKPFKQVEGITAPQEQVF